MQRVRPYDSALEPMEDLELFEDAAPAAVQGTLERAQVLRAAPGEVVLAPDSSNARVFIVLKGTLRVDLAGGEGRAKHVDRGKCVGELSVIDGSRTSATVTAVDECELLELDGESILLLADRSHVVARNLLRVLSRRLRGTNRLLREEAEESKLLRKQAATDALTGLLTRAWLDDMLTRLSARANHGGSFAVAMSDVDHFKSFNDTYGHLVGDRVLQRVAAAMRDCLRPTDYAARYGGEEFVAVLPGVTRIEDAVKAAERMRRAVAKVVLMPERGAESPKITVSVGVGLHQAGDTPATLLDRADRALYRAKHGGRDRVEH